MNQIHKSKIEKMLSEEFCCTPAQLNGNGALYTVKSHTEKPFLKILAYRNCVAVCTSEDIAGAIRRLLRNKNRDEIFELPFVYGQTIHYILDHVPSGGNSIPSDYHCEFLFGNEIRSLNGQTGFENSLAFDGDGGTAAQAVYIARDGGKIIGAAGAAKTLADRGDLPRILQIYGRARRFMKESGNASQWKDGFPPESLLAEDIRAGHLYVVRGVKDKTIHGVFAFIIGDDPTYAKIEQGRWLSDAEYGTLHRVAGDGTVHGIFAAAAEKDQGEGAFAVCV